METIGRDWNAKSAKVQGVAQSEVNKPAPKH